MKIYKFHGYLQKRFSYNTHGFFHDGGVFPNFAGNFYCAMLCNQASDVAQSIAQCCAILCFSAVSTHKIRIFLNIYVHFCLEFGSVRLFCKIMEPVRKVRRVETVPVDEECPILLSDYLEKIAGEVYIAVTEFSGENFVHLRRYYTDRDGNLRPRKEGAALTLGQFAMLVDSMYETEFRYWALEEGLPISPFEQYVGPWKLNIDIFGNFSI